MLEFTHQFEDEPLGDLSVSLSPPAGARISVSVEPDGNIWLSANRAGWLHLARICAELGTRVFEPGYHFHRDLDFNDSDGDQPELSFEVGK